MRYIIAFWLVSLLVAYGAGIAAEQGHNLGAAFLGSGALGILVLAVMPESKKREH